MPSANIIYHSIIFIIIFILFHLHSPFHSLIKLSLNIPSINILIHSLILISIIHPYFLFLTSSLIHHLILLYFTYHFQSFYLSLSYLHHYLNNLLPSPSSSHTSSSTPLISYPKQILIHIKFTHLSFIHYTNTLIILILFSLSTKYFIITTSPSFVFSSIIPLTLPSLSFKCTFTQIKYSFN